MNERADQEMLRELLWRLTALEDSVAFLEVWCEEQQDALDRVGEAVDFYDDEEVLDQKVPERARLYVIDGHNPAVPEEESDYQRKVRQIRARLDRLRSRLGPGVVAGTRD